MIRVTKAQREAIDAKVEEDGTGAVYEFLCKLFPGLDKSPLYIQDWAWCDDDLLSVEFGGLGEEDDEIDGTQPK